MLRAHLTETKHCYLHPHRVVKTACARCKTPYCDDCLGTRDTGLFARIVAQDEKQPAPLFCERCVQEVEVLEAQEAERKRPLHQRLRPTRGGIRRAAIWVAVIAVVLVPMTVGVRSLAESTLTPEELQRIRQGLTGGFLTPDGINLVSSTFQGRFIRASAPAPLEHQPTRLIDGWATAEVPGWRTADPQLPVDLVFAMAEKQRVNTVVVRPHPTEPPETWVRDFEVWVSDSPDSGFTRAVSGRLQPASSRAPAATRVASPGLGPGLGLVDVEERHTFPQVTAQYVMLRVLSTQGSGQYASLGELEVYWTPQAK